MKTFTKISLMVFAIILATHAARAQKVLSFEGLYSQGEGGAAWNADGTGPEPYGNGHGGVYYYTASRDYVDPASTAGAHMLDNIIGFPLFGQALINNGFTAAKVTVKVSLASLGEDVEGIDWFQIGSINYSNFYPIKCTFELDGEPMAEAVGNYAIYKSGAGFQGFESAFLKVNDISAGSSNPVKFVAAALLDDLDKEEFKFDMQVTSAANLTGNGRTGGYFNVYITIEAGLPTLPFKGLYADDQGVAGWDADGTGPEPYANGHLNYLYYGASVDYDGINSSPDACLGHCLEGSAGFLNTLLQLDYRGFEIDNLKMKLGLASFGPDVQGEDWGYENGNHWLNQYNNGFTILLNAEPILYVLVDTNKMVSLPSHWITGTSAGKVYNISANASPAAQFVAQSFLRDMGTHCLRINTSSLTYAGSFSGNGRNGAYHQIDAGELTGVHENITFVPPGEVSGTWTAEGSPYYVDGHLEIANGETLIIAPGVKVAVRGPYHFTVQGCVKAEGNEDEKIIFTRSNPNLWWDGFDYEGTPATNPTSLFSHCLFEHGKAQGYFPLNSGGIFAIKDYDNILIEQSVFRSNEAMLASGGYGAGGGAIALWAASPVISHNVFYDNKSMYGGAIFCYESSSPEIVRNLFYSNQAVNDGGAIELWGSCHPTIINNTFTMNTATSGGGAIDIYLLSNPILVNNIFWENTANTGSQICLSSNNCSPVVKYCDVQGGQAGIGPYAIPAANYKDNIEADPLFQDVTVFNFLLDEFTPSPCINAGDPSTPPDPDGTPADMGCFYQDISTGIISHINLENTLLIYPVPFTDNICIGFELTEPSDASICIYNSASVLVAMTDLGILQPGKQEKQWNVVSLPDGVYLLVTKINHEHFTRKVVKTK